MSAPKTSRRRAVRLRPEALEALGAALTDRWQRDARGVKLTREAQAELLGVSVATAKRILSGDGVDRATLALAFKSVGLAWNEGLCEPLSDAPQLPEPEPSSALDDLPPGPSEPMPSAPRRRRLLGALFLGLAALAGWGVTLSIGRPKPEGYWLGEFNAMMARGVDLYHAAEYDAARKEVARAFSLSRAHDSAGRMAYATHIEGDLEAARGRLLAAKDCYLRELAIRRTELDDAQIPPILESLGDVETRLGDYRSARDHLRLALEEFRRLRRPFEVASVQRDMGSVSLGTGDFDAADDWFRQSLDDLRGMAQPATEADVRGRMALVLLARGRAAEARPLLQDCLAFWTKRGHARWIALSDMNLGLVEARLQDLASARTRIVRSRDAFVRVGDRARVAEAEGHLRRLAALVAQIPKG